jgi:uncharacterized protein (TIGR03437 family)
VFLGSLDSTTNVLSFKGPTQYSAGNGPQVVITADFNGDGVADLATANSDGTVAVLLGKGDGTFQAPKILSVGQGAFSLAAADVNGDGHLDLAVYGYLDNAYSTFIFPGNGDGTFGPLLSTVSNMGGALVLQDFTGDGIPDLLVTTVQSNQPSLAILPGNGTGGFGTPIPAPPNPFLRAFSIAYGDFNHDGRMDFAGMTDGQLAVYLNTGNGAFSPPELYTCASAEYLSIADLNGDGSPDLVIEDSINGILQIVFGSPDGTFYAPSAFAFGSGIPQGNPRGIVFAGDFNGDGKPDVLNVDDTGIQFLPGNGDGTLGAPVSSALAFSNDAVLGDFNGDGKMDVAGSLQNAGLAVAFGNGDGTFRTPVAISSFQGAVASADFNGDGKPDIAAVQASSTLGGAAVLKIFLSTGAGFTAGPSVNLPGNSYLIAAGDLNDDGKPDLVISDGGGNPSTPLVSNVYVLLNQGDGTFAPPVEYAAGSLTTLIALADMNNDGRLDILVTTENPEDHGNNAVAILLGNGDGTFQAAQLFPTAFGPSSLNVADYNGDGKPDVVVAHCCGQTVMSYLLGNGDGTLQAEQIFPGGGSMSSVATADFNHDGKPDLAIQFASIGDALALNTFPSFAGTVNAASFSATGTVAPDSIAAAFGVDLANTTDSAAGTLGTTLGGTTVSVADSAGTVLPASLFFVSPGQVNFAVPAGLASGTGTILITSGDGTFSSGPVTIAPVAPGIFSLDGVLAAALSLTINSQGQQIYQPVFQYNSASSQYEPLPIAINGPTYLILYGTGIRGAPLSEVSVQIGGTTVAPAYAGAAAFTGEDQVNVLLPSSLSGAGDVTITLTAAGIAANPVHVTIQ